MATNTRPIKHGTVHAYKKHGCTCEECVKAFKDYNKLSYARRKRGITKTPEICTACEEWDSATSRCAEVFKCKKCGRVLQKCSYLVGGMDSTKLLCNLCLFKAFSAELKAAKKSLKYGDECGGLPLDRINHLR